MARRSPVRQVDFVFSLEETAIVRGVDARQRLEVGAARPAAATVGSPEPRHPHAAVATGAERVGDRNGLRRAESVLHLAPADAVKHPVPTASVVDIAGPGSGTRQRAPFDDESRTPSGDDRHPIV